MRADRGDVHAWIDAWRRQGADRVDPLRFGLIAALARRALRHGGMVRQRLDARLRKLAEAYAGLLANPPQAKPLPAVRESPLKPLLERFAHAPQPDAPVHAAAATRKVEARGPAPVVDTARLPALDEFQQLWSRIRIDSLLRQCLDALPDDAGPLHSRVLTYRAMVLMRDVSPDYLQHFIAYADVLTWMERVDGRPLPGVEGSDAAGVRKPARAGGPRRKKQAADTGP